ncbi:MAG: hypothetical protein E2O68_08420 [Deltaproteobacteria bacterium]|nr:MAG: hypothetical protein E2O68_08420 [Deltaproteobacteria bacterium]
MNDAKPYTTLLGKNYLSFLMSFGLLEKTKEVVILDEKEANFPICPPLCDLEKSILHTWGKDLNYHPLKQIDDYILCTPVTFILDGIQVHLGRNPWQNLRELLRKLPHVFTPEATLQFFRHNESKFNESYFSYTARLGETIFRFKNIPNLNFQTFMESCPVELKGPFDNLKEGVFKDDLFRFLCQAFFQRKISRSTSEFELFHIFLCLLSPHYEVKQEALENDLEDKFIKVGGLVRPGPVKNMDFKGRKLWRINFEKGKSLTTKDVYFSKGLFFSSQFKVSTKRPMYTSVNIRWSFERLPIEYLELEKIVISDQSRMGAFGPYTEIRLLKNRLWAQVLVPYEIGAKVEFYQKQITSILKKDLGKVWVDWWEEPVEDRMEMGEFLWPVTGRKAFSLGRVEFKLPEKLSIHGISNSKKLFGLKNLHYLGNFGGETLGLLSTLMEIKDLRPYK